MAPAVIPVPENATALIPATKWVMVPVMANAKFAAP